MVARGERRSKWFRVGAVSLTAVVISAAVAFFALRASHGDAPHLDARIAARTPDTVDTNNTTPPTFSGDSSSSTDQTATTDTTVPQSSNTATVPTEVPTTAYVPPTTVPTVRFDSSAVLTGTVSEAQQILGSLGFSTSVQMIGSDLCGPVHADRVQQVSLAGFGYLDPIGVVYGVAPQGASLTLWVC